MKLSLCNALKAKSTLSCAHYAFFFPHFNTFFKICNAVALRETLCIYLHGQLTLTHDTDTCTFQPHTSRRSTLEQEVVIYEQQRLPNDYR